MESVAITVRPTSQERLAATLAHAGTFVAWTLAPLVVYALKKGESRYVEFQALQALLWSLLGTVISIATCGVAIPCSWSGTSSLRFVRWTAHPTTTRWWPIGHAS